MMIGGFVILCGILAVGSLGIAGFLAYKAKDEWVWFLVGAMVVVGAAAITIETQILEENRTERSRSIETDNGSDPAG